MRPEDEDMIFLDAIVVMSADVSCYGCHKTETIYPISDEYEAVDIMKQRGWKATKYGNVYCPKCVSKKLKPKRNDQAKFYVYVLGSHHVLGIDNWMWKWTGTI